MASVSGQRNPAYVVRLTGIRRLGACAVFDAVQNRDNRVFPCLGAEQRNGPVTKCKVRRIHPRLCLLSVNENLFGALKNTFETFWSTVWSGLGGEDRSCMELS